MQESTTRNFIGNARAALDDGNLQQALGTMKTGFVEKRRQARARLPEFDDIRDQAREIKNHSGFIPATVSGTMHHHGRQTT